MKLYFTKVDLYGVPRGCVERFAISKGEALVASGEIEPYDSNDGRHRAAAERAGYSQTRTAQAIPDKRIK